jgi:hypothetical protein
MRRHQLFGYSISAKRYALYSRSGNDIHIEKASGHGLGYLFAPKERKKDEQSDDEGTPKWVMEAGHCFEKGIAIGFERACLAGFTCYDANGSDDS